MQPNASIAKPNNSSGDNRRCVVWTVIELIENDITNAWGPFTEDQAKKVLYEKMTKNPKQRIHMRQLLTK